MLQVRPDWSLAARTGDQIKDEVQGLDFSGPGLYVNDEYTILITVSKKVKKEELWKQEQPKNMVYDVHVWNVPLSQTIIGEALGPFHIPIKAGKTS